MTGTASPRGVYGLRLAGVPDAARLLGRVAVDAPTLTVERRVDRTVTLHPCLDGSQARLPLQGGGWVTVDRCPPRARFVLHSHATDEQMVHPYLSGTAAAVNRWLGRDAFHGGAFVEGGGAWAILADKEGGKSSTLAYLALHRTPILTDDLVVLDDGNVLPGPACIDLRGEAASHLGSGEPIGVVGARERWRMFLPIPPDPTPLQGWILPSWGPLQITRLAPAARLAALLPHAAILVHPRVPPERLLQLAALPCYTFRRPRTWDAIDAAVRCLLEALGG